MRLRGHFISLLFAALAPFFSFSAALAAARTPNIIIILASDPGEKFDVAHAHPEVLKAIDAELEKHRKDLVVGKQQY